MIARTPAKATPAKAPAKTSGVSILIAAIVIAWVAAMIGVTFHAAEKLAAAYGPAKIARAADGSVWVATFGKLQHLRDDGTRIEVVDLNALGLGELLSEIVPLSDGSLLLAEAKPSQLLRCELKPPKCTSISEAITASAGPTTHALMVAVNEPAGRMAVSDNAGHRVLLTDLAGKVIDKTAPWRLRYPNELAIDNESVTVADTNHHRIVRIALTNDHFAQDLSSFAITDPAIVGPNLPPIPLAGRIWPMDFVRLPSGDWWVLNEANGMKNGFLVAYTPAGKPARHIDLGVMHDPTQLLVMDKFVLAASPLEGLLNKLDFDGRVLGPFGDAAFNADVEAGQAIKNRWAGIRLAAQIGMALIPFLGIALLYLRGERIGTQGGVLGFGKSIDKASVDAAGPPAALAEGTINWIAFNEPVIKELRRRIWFISVAMLVVLVLIGYTSYSLMSVARLRPVVLLLFGFQAFTLLFVAIAGLLKVPRFPRLGTDGQYVYWSVRGKEPKRVAISDVLAARNSLLLGRRMVRLRLPRGNIYDTDEIQRVLLSRLPKTAWIRSSEMFLIGLRRGMWWAWGTVLAFALVISFFAHKYDIDAYIKTLVVKLVSANTIPAKPAPGPK